MPQPEADAGVIIAAAFIVVGKGVFTGEVVKNFRGDGEGFGDEEFQPAAVSRSR